MGTIYTILGKVVVGVAAYIVVGFTLFSAWFFPSQAIAERRYDRDRRKRIEAARSDDGTLRLLTADGGEEVIRLAPSPLMDKDGKLPDIICWDGRTFERGWTNEGNTDADERLWFEVKK
jgi:hypothetical protein